MRRHHTHDRHSRDGDDDGPARPGFGRFSGRQQSRDPFGESHANADRNRGRDQHRDRDRDQYQDQERERDPQPSGMGGKRGMQLTYTRQMPKFLQRATQNMQNEEDNQHEERKREILRRLEAAGVDSDLPVVEDVYGILRENERDEMIGQIQRRLENEARADKGLSVAEESDLKLRDGRKAESHPSAKDLDIQVEEPPAFVNGKPVFRKSKKMEQETATSSLIVSVGGAKKKTNVQASTRAPSKGKLSFDFDNEEDEDAEE
eukprot:TRINITY_DN7098_c0_g2_i1.p2 TRINITY_DN7098_c0_g2~~TRINITY_DN7098_c0_g2_i1.p2  ORF type:complete len:261 (+),score=63.12 TRINITY_DN7098_c0_g2_i1:57-839(+)